MITYVVMMMMTEFLVLNTSKWWDPVVSIPFNLFVYVGMSWMICLLASCAGNRYSKYIHLLCHVLLFAYVISDVFLFIFFHRHWDAFTIQFLWETNLRETMEFVEGFVLNFKILYLLLPSFFFFVGEIWLARRTPSLPIFPKGKLGRAMFSVGALVLLVQGFYFSSDFEQNYDRMARYPSPMKRNNIWELYQSFLQYRYFQKEYDRCAMSLKQYGEHTRCLEKNADFVLIIGESFNRHYSNLYGGRWDTNPKLASLLKTGRLFVFHDVIASDNGTSQNFKYLLSMNGVKDKRSWCDVPLLPAVMRRCGYHVIFYGNQFVVNDVLGEFDCSMGYLNHPYIATHIFDERNTHTYPYDMGLVNDYVRHRHEIEKSKKNFVIFHLYGQHMPAAIRYPANYSKYNADNIECKDKTSQQCIDIANYLNATYYNDAVVAKIISLFEHRNAVVLYLADHGEEIHDFRNQYGRTDLSIDSKKALKPQLDIPFMIYLSPAYAQLHPWMADRIRRAVDVPFMSDDLAQVVCDILGVQSSFVNDKRSVTSPAYIQPGHRILQNGRSYD